MNNIFKKFAVNLGVGVATEIVRGWLNEKLKDITPSDLYEAIIYDRDLWNATPEDIKKQGVAYKGRFSVLFKKYEDRINTELILQWIQEDHPDLFSTLLNTPPEGSGFLWLDKQVRRIKAQLMQM